MAFNWGALGRQIGRLVIQEAPRLFKQLQNSGALGQGKAEDRSSAPVPARKPGRPATQRSVPSAQRARQLQYSPNLDGKADPGEIVWTWVAYEEDPSQGKDRPVLVVGREGNTLLGLMLSSQSKHEGDRDWLGLGAGPWDADGRPSWLRLDRVLDVPEEGIRREGAVLDKARFDQVSAQLRSHFGWS